MRRPPKEIPFTTHTLADIGELYEWMWDQQKHELPVLETMAQLIWGLTARVATLEAELGHVASTPVPPPEWRPNRQT